MPARLLIIDDDDDIRDSLVSLLASEGYQTRGAPGATEAIRTLATGDYRPDAILLDLLMPKMNGAQLAEEIWGNPAWARIPLIVCSAGPVPAETQARAFAVLQKPFDLERLLELIEAACRTR